MPRIRRARLEAALYTELAPALLHARLDELVQEVGPSARSDELRWGAQYPRHAADTGALTSRRATSQGTRGSGHAGSSCSRSARTASSNSQSRSRST